MVSERVEAAKATIARVLVVDANGSMRTLLIDALRRCGWQTEGAADGWEALSRLTREQYTVVVTDIHMPRMDGLALLRAVRSLARPMPVVVQTVLLQPTLEGLLEQAGAFRVVMKGGPIGDLVRTVADACAASASAPA